MQHNKINKCALAVKLSLLVGSTALSMPAFAADEIAKEQQVEVIQVRGIKASQVASMNAKRFNEATVDVVTAEDIGKFPDNNVAEALGRVPGVTVSRQFGEGDAVSIRGASNQLTLTTLNGQNVASAGWYSQQAIDRTFNYSMLAPELIGGIDVYKSSQADLLEGGIGGTVVVNTRKPLDLDPLTVFGSVKGTKSSAADDTDASLSGLVSWKNANESFGILAAIAKSDYSLERRGDESLPSWGGRIAPTHFRQERERTSYDIAAQFAPSDALVLGVNFMSLELGADSVNTAVWIPQNLDNCSLTNGQGVPLICSTAAEDGQDAFWDVRPRNATMKTDHLSADLRYEGDGFKLDLQLGQSKATGGTNFETNFGYLSGVGGAVGTIDASGETVKFYLEPHDFPLPNAGEYAGWEGLQAPGQVVQQPREDKEKYAQLDVEFDTDFGVIRSVKTGARYAKHDIIQDQYRPVMPGFDGAAQAALVDGSRFASGTLTAGLDHFVVPAPNAAEMIAYTNSFIDSWVQTRSGYATVTEDNIALYAMANFDGEGFRGNFGLRYVRTEASSDAFRPEPGFVDPVNALNNGYSTDIVTESGSYSHFLPSLNIAYDLEDDLVLRFSAATVIARPNYNDMFSNAALAGESDNIPGNEAVNKGNPALKPFKANQIDLGLEWYYSPSSLFASTLFWKDISSFTTAANTPNQSIGIVSPDTGEDNWLLQSTTNGSNGKIQGIEFQWQHGFDNGFGTIVNYTLSDAKADRSNYDDRNPEFSDSSKHTINMVGYYENEVFSARAAYTWRSEYMIRETGFYGNREHQPFGSLDLSFTYAINDNLTLVADVTNLLQEDSVQVGRDRTAQPTFWRTSDGYPAYAYEGESRYSLGVQYRF